MKVGDTRKEKEEEYDPMEVGGYSFVTSEFRRHWFKADTLQNLIGKSLMDQALPVEVRSDERKAEGTQNAGPAVNVL
uniref:Uncharacterized protein n=1 Tax=Vespula pensylvanica TaxID=30213 RepID=A0A834K1K7_VESPE|nr:hypothetical protein H0235_016163 [Vespula pensylvanica]